MKAANGRADREPESDRDQTAPEHRGSPGPEPKPRGREARHDNSEPKRECASESGAREPLSGGPGGNVLQ